MAYAIFSHRRRRRATSCRWQATRTAQRQVVLRASSGNACILFSGGLHVATQARDTWDGSQNMSASASSGLIFSVACVGNDVDGVAGAAAAGLAAGAVAAAGAAAAAAAGSAAAGAAAAVGAAAVGAGVAGTGSATAGAAVAAAAVVWEPSCSGLVLQHPIIRRDAKKAAKKALNWKTRVKREEGVKMASHPDQIISSGRPLFNQPRKKRCQKCELATLAAGHASYARRSYGFTSWFTLKKKSLHLHYT